MHLLAVINMRLLTVLYLRTHATYQIQIMTSLSDKDAAYLIESVVRGLNICKRVRSPTVCEDLQLTREDRNDHFAACLQV